MIVDEGLEFECPGRIPAAELEEVAGDEDASHLTRRGVLASGALAGIGGQAREVSSLAAATGSGSDLASTRAPRE